MRAFDAELLLAMAQRADDDTQADHAVQNEHDDRVERVAHQRGLRLVAEHDRDDQAELDDRNRQCQQDRAERLADAKRHDLGVMYRVKHRRDQSDDQRHGGDDVRGNLARQRR